MKPLFLSLVVVLAGCGRKEAATVEAPRPSVRATVETVTAQSWPETYSTTGTVEAMTRAVLSAQVAGTVRQIMVEPGAFVAAGQTLVTLNASQFAVAQAQGEAGEREARAALPEVDSAIASAQAAVQLATLNEGRMRELLAKKSVTRQEMDEAETRARQAQAQLAMAQARRKQVEFKVAQAEQGVQSAKVFAGYTVITAPFAGVVVEKLAEAGSLAAPGVPLLTLERGHRLVVSVPESQAPQVKVGQALRVVWDDGSEPVTVRVTEILPVVDAASRTLTAKASLTARPGLRSGASARVEWPLPAQPGLSVPVAAVRTQGQLQQVFLVEGGVARLRMLTLGEPRDGRWRVLAGLNAGEVVIAALTPAMVDGARIEVQR